MTTDRGILTGRRRTIATERSELVRLAHVLLRRAAHLLIITENEDAARTSNVECIDDELSIVADHLYRRLKHSVNETHVVLAEMSATLAEVHAIRHEIAGFLMHERLRRFAALEHGLAELRHLTDPAELLQRVCEAVVNCCAFDRAMLSRIDQAFAQIYERAVLLSSMRSQHAQLRSAMQNAVSVLDELAAAEIDLSTPAEPAGTSPCGPARSPANYRSTDLGALLTVRELEVLTLMATGATNQRIAEQLVISDGTVKSHVKRILRKLCVRNRSEAISQFLHLTIGNDGATGPPRGC